MILSVLALLIGGARIYGIKHIAFQAVAHLFVGFLFGKWITKRERKDIILFWILCVVEVVCFLIGLLK